MSDTLNQGEEFSFEAMQEGVFAAAGQRPQHGFEWQDGIGPSSGLWLVPRPGRWRRYPLMQRHRTLAAGFRTLAETPSDSAVLTFANKWGWLGPQSLREAAAEPLAFWREELAAYRDLYRLWLAVSTLRDDHAVGPGALRDARRYLEARIIWNGVQAVRYQDAPSGRPFIATAPSDRDLLQRFRAGDVVLPAHYYVCREVNRQLRGRINLTVLPFRGNELRHFPDSLIGAIYLSFAMELSGGKANERACQQCGLPFTPRRRDQRYHTKKCRELAGYHRRKDQEVRG